jgi:hypothetical protein
LPHESGRTQLPGWTQERCFKSRASRYLDGLAGKKKVGDRMSNPEKREATWEDLQDLKNDLADVVGRYRRRLHINPELSFTSKLKTERGEEQVTVKVKEIPEIDQARLPWSDVAQTRNLSAAGAH